MMQSKVVLLQCAFPSQAAPNSTEVSVLYLWNAVLLTDTFIFVLTSNCCSSMGYLRLVIDVKHKVSILVQ